MALIRKRRLTEQQQRRIQKQQKHVRKKSILQMTLKVWWYSIMAASLKWKPCLFLLNIRHNL